jgi:dTDP-glucose 4,6-dehydratase/UDP-glucuronate decarboxylase
MAKLFDLILDDTADILKCVDFSPIEGREVLITGASGLLGVYMLAALHKWNLEHDRSISVTALTRSPLPDWLSELTKTSNMRLLRGDLSDPLFYGELPAADVIVHAAGYAQPGKFLENPTKTIQINTTATVALLEKLRPKGKFLFLSSSEVYSGSPETPYREDSIGTTNPSHTRACYIEGKRCGEAICHAIRRQGNDIKIGRIALTYGPGTRTDDVRVLNTLIRQALIHRRIDLRDQGAATRTVGYVTDVVELLLHVLISGREATYNVGGTSKITILALAKMVGRILDVPVTTPDDDSDPTGAAAEVDLDLSRACGEFGKHDFVSLEDGLLRTIEWQKQLYRDFSRDE